MCPTSPNRLPALGLLCVMSTAGWSAAFSQSHAGDTLQLQGAILKTIESTAVAAEVPGIILELNAKEGDVVEAGQTLGKIKDEAVRMELAQLKTQIELARTKQANDINQRLAEKSRQVAHNEYERALNANARVPGTYPLNEIDRLKLVADQAQLEVERALHDQQLAGYEVSLALGNYRQVYERFTRHQIVAPTAGVIVAVDKRSGEWVEPGAELLRIVRTNPLRVEGFVAANLASSDLVGREAHVTLADNPQATPVVGRVVFVSPDVNPVNSQVRVFLEIDNADEALRPGLRVNAWIDR